MSFSHLHIGSNPAEVLAFSLSHKAKQQPLQTSRDLDVAGPLRLLDSTCGRMDLISRSSADMSSHLMYALLRVFIMGPWLCRVKSRAD